MLAMAVSPSRRLGPSTPSGNAFEVASRVVKRETKGQQGSTQLGDCAPDSKNRSAFLYEREASTKVSRPGGVEGDGR